MDHTEWFRGYAMLGQAFASGEVIAFRRWDWSSIGPPFTTVWLRHASGEWTLYTNVSPTRSCPRYFGSAFAHVLEDSIDVSWNGSHEMSVSVRSARLHLALRLATTPLTKALGVVADLMPDAVWRTDRGSAWIGAAAGSLLGTGPITLAGRSPLGYRYLNRPRDIWKVTAAAAVIAGRDLGEPVPLDCDVDMGGFRIPRTGLLAMGRSVWLANGPALA